MTKYLRSKVNGHVFIDDGKLGKMEHMEPYEPPTAVRKVAIKEPEPEQQMETKEEPAAQADREVLARMYEQKHGKRPHPNMRLDTLIKAVSNDEHHHSG